MGLGQGTACEQSQLCGIPGEQDLRPSTHWVTLQGQAASACPSPGPPRSYFRPAYSLGCPSSLGSVSRTQTRQHERLVLNPKRIPLRAPSRGNRAVHTVRPAGTTRLEDGDSAGQRAGSERAVPGPVVRVMEPPCRQETSQLCVGNCWSAGGRVSAAGRGQQQALRGSQPWLRWTAGRGRGGQQLCPVVGCAGWAGDRWAGQTLGSSPWGLGRREPVSHCSWLGSDLSWEAASRSPLCFLGQNSLPRAEIHACCPRVLGQERGLGTALTSRSSGTHLSRSEVRASP